MGRIQKAFNSKIRKKRHKKKIITENIKNFNERRLDEYSNIEEGLRMFFKRYYEKERHIVSYGELLKYVKSLGYNNEDIIKTLDNF